MKIGIFTVSMPDYEPERAMEVASVLGYNGLEWRVCADAGDRNNPSFWSGNRTSMTPEILLEKAAELCKTAEKLQIEMPSLGSYIDCTEVDEAEKVFRAANAVGAKAARVNTTAYDPEKPYKTQIAENRDAFGKIEKLAKRYHVKALLETHVGRLTPTVVGALPVLDGLDPENVGIMWDPGNQASEGLERYDMAIRAAGPYLGEVHVKNRSLAPTVVKNGRVTWVPQNSQLQFGSVDWSAIIAELKLNHYDGWLMLEDFSTIQPLNERLKNNIDFLRGACGVI